MEQVKQAWEHERDRKAFLERTSSDNMLDGKSPNFSKVWTTGSIERIACPTGLFFVLIRANSDYPYFSVEAEREDGSTFELCQNEATLRGFLKDVKYLYVKPVNPFGAMWQADFWVGFREKAYQTMDTMPIECRR